MAYQNINIARYKFLLTHGTDDEELRRFFSEKRLPLMQKGAKVQNLPHGPKARVTTIAHLPFGTDQIVQQWFLNNLTMIDPEPVDELIETFCLFEEEGESLPDGDAKRLSRSCLMHLFSNEPAPQLLAFLRSPIGGDDEDSHQEAEADRDDAQRAPFDINALASFAPDLARALVLLFDNKDPDEHLALMPSPIASLVSGFYALRAGNVDDAKNALEDLNEYEQIKNVLLEYSARLVKAKEKPKPISTGLQLCRFEEPDYATFDLDRDLVIGKCTKDFPQNAVFIQPFAILTGDGRLVSLEKQAVRENLLPHSGDVQAFSGHIYPKQPSRGEIGIWQIARNETFGSTTHRTQFHLVSTKTDVYEVRTVPFTSNDFDSVRGFIKEQIASLGRRQLEPLLFLLRDDLIVGCPPGRDLTRDEGFDDGLPCWSSLKAFRFEGRVLAPGPLPSHEQYECATVASTLKRFFASHRSGAEKLTKSQQKHLVDWINSGEANLSASRKDRLLSEIKYIEEDQEATAIFMDAALASEKIAAKIDRAVQEKIDEESNKKSQIAAEIEQLENQRRALKENITKKGQELRALPSSVSKAVKEAIRKAKEDAVETLGEVIMFKAFLDEMGGPRVSSDEPSGSLPKSLTSIDHDSTPLQDTLKFLGLTSKYAHALEVVSDAVFNAGMILVIEGVAARLAAVSLGRRNQAGCLLMDCEVGITSDNLLKQVTPGETRTLVLLDANLSPPDLYARPLIDQVHRKIAGFDASLASNIIMSLSDGVAGLPFPNSINAVSIRVSLDHKPSFLGAEEAVEKVEELRAGESDEQWSFQLWRPALSSLVEALSGMPRENLALALSIIAAGDRVL